MLWWLTQGVRIFPFVFAFFLSTCTIWSMNSCFKTVSAHDKACLNLVCLLVKKNKYVIRMRMCPHSFQNALFAVLCMFCFRVLIAHYWCVIIRGFERDLFGSFGKGLYNNQIFSCLHMIQTVLLLCFIYIYYVCIHISTCLLAVACSELHALTHTQWCVRCIMCVWHVMCVAVRECMLIFERVSK